MGDNAVVDPSGNIYLCTPTVGKQEFCIGNVKVDGFSASWLNALREKMIKTLSNRSNLGLCPAECREHQHNQRIDSYLLKDSVAEL